MIVWSIRGKLPRPCFVLSSSVIFTVTCAVLCMIVAHSDMHTYEQLIRMSVGFSFSTLYVFISGLA